MKIVLFGATGLVGGALLRCAIRESAITSVVAVSRRELPADLSSDSKVEVVIVDDFQNYTDAVIEKLKGSQICLWAIGGRVKQFADSKTARLANVDYLLSAAQVLAGKISTALKDQKFRFVYCSGSFTERDTTKRLLFLDESRKLKGEAENGLLEIEKSHTDTFEVFIARPAGVLDSEFGFQNKLYGPLGIGKTSLAYAMIDIALNGAEHQVTESVALRSRGTELARADRANS